MHLFLSPHTVSLPLNLSRVHRIITYTISTMGLYQVSAFIMPCEHLKVIHTEVLYMSNILLLLSIIFFVINYHYYCYNDS